MKILYLGDIVGKSGRQAVHKYLPELKTNLQPDVIIANGENSAHGFGITPKIAEEFFELGIDVITLGNHSYDNKSIIPYLSENKNILISLNEKEKPKNSLGYIKYKMKNGQSILITMLLGSVYMNTPIENPFIAINNLLRDCKLKRDVDAIFVDIHAETTSEKYAIGQYLDGSVSAVIGSHTHVPSGDSMIRENGTAYQTDAGMCGDYDSVIGMDKKVPIHRFKNATKEGRFTPAENEGTICGAFIEIDNATGLAISNTPIRQGKWLLNTL